MKTKEINKLIRTHREYLLRYDDIISLNTISDSLTRHIEELKEESKNKIQTLTEVIDGREKLKKAKQDNKAAKSKFKLVDIKHVPGFFDELQGWLDDISIEPCNEKFNPWAKCANTENIGNYILSMVPDENEHGGYKYYKFDENKWKQIHKTEFNKIQKEINDKCNEDKEDKIVISALQKVIDQQREKLHELDKMIIEQDSYVVRLKAENSSLSKYNDELTELVNKQKTEITGANIKIDAYKTKLEQKDNQIAEQAGTITRLTNELRANKYTKEDLMKCFIEGRIKLGGTSYKYYSFDEYFEENHENQNCNDRN